MSNPDLLYIPDPEMEIDPKVHILQELGLAYGRVSYQEGVEASSNEARTAKSLETALDIGLKIKPGEALDEKELESEEHLKAFQKEVIEGVQKLKALGLSDKENIKEQIIQWTAALGE